MLRPAMSMNRLSQPANSIPHICLACFSHSQVFVGGVKHVPQSIILPSVPVWPFTEPCSNFRHCSNSGPRRRIPRLQERIATRVVVVVVVVLVLVAINKDRDMRVGVSRCDA